MIMPIDATARFDGRGAGWLVYGPDTAHVPTVAGGKALVLYLLPRRRDRVHEGVEEPGADEAFARSDGRSTMPSLSKADHRVTPPQVAIPRDYNAAHDLIERNLAAGRAGKTAFIDDRGAYTYGELARARQPLRQCADAASACSREQRVLLCLHDTIDFPAAFLGASRPASCRLRATRCSRRRITSTCCATAAPAR